MKMWMIVTVETELEWPIEETSATFMGSTFVLRPHDSKSAADVRLQYDHPRDERQAFEKICRFLTALSWWHHRPARARLRIGCTAPMRGGKGSNDPPLRKNYRLSQSIKSPSNSKFCLALALYREAVSVENTAYEFLGYFKIINICYHFGKEQITWINKILPQLTDKRARGRITELAISQNNIGEYLYRSGRCAVAHASTSDVVNPDNPDDVFRLSADMPVARALAEYLIEKEFGIKCEMSR